MLLPFWGSVFGTRFVVHCFACNHLDGEERAGCFALYVFLVSCDWCCSMAPSYDPVGWSAVCDCGIS